MFPDKYAATLCKERMMLICLKCMHVQQYLMLRKTDTEDFLLMKSYLILVYLEQIMYISDKRNVSYVFIWYEVSCSKWRSLCEASIS